MDERSRGHDPILVAATQDLAALSTMSNTNRMIEATYKFTGNDSTVRVLSANQPSTDALTLLSQWERRHQGRSFEVIEDSDGHLLVKLALRDEDAQAGHDLQTLGVQHGVQHEFVER